MSSYGFSKILSIIINWFPKMKALKRLMPKSVSSAKRQVREYLKRIQL